VGNMESKMIFQHIRVARLKLKPSKCSFFQTKIAFQGFIVSEAGIEVQKEKLQVVVEWPITRKSVRFGAIWDCVATIIVS